MRESKKSNVFKSLRKFTCSCKWKVIFSIVFAVLGVVSGITPFVAATRIIEGLFLGNSDIGFYIAWGLGVAGGGALLKVLLMLLSTSLSHISAFNILEEIRLKIAAKLTCVPMGVIADMSSGKIRKTAVDDVEKLEIGIAHMVPEVLGNIMGVIVIAVYLFYLDWRIGLAAITSLPLGAVAFSGVMKDYKAKWARYTKAAGNMNTTIVEYVGGIEVIKAFGQSAKSYSKYSDAVNENNAATTEWQTSSRWWMAATYTIWPAVLLFVLPVGLSLFLNGHLEAFTFVSTAIVSLCLTGPIIHAVSYADQLAEVSTVLKNVDDLLSIPEMTRPEEYTSLTGNSIRMRNVCFAYKEKEVLHNVNLTFESGKLKALVGPSGGGKTTIARLIAGYWDISSGELNVFGKDCRHIPFRQLNENISYVTQDNFLFDMSIKNNIRMGNPNASDEQIYRASIAANCHEFIMGMPEKYETMAGDSGAFLSGGERQRITIARAILKNAPVVILDEATSYSDIENEHEIQKALNNLAKGRTLIVIAHRLHTIVNSDKIAVIDKGEVVGEGKHEELLQNCPVYQKMWSTYRSLSEERKDA
jgi:ATP-binding cassette subfamily B protein